ncbi:hypothetical protein [Pyrobaculum sp.]
MKVYVKGAEIERREWERAKRRCREFTWREAPPGFRKIAFEMCIELLLNI